MIRNAAWLLLTLVATGAAPAARQGALMTTSVVSAIDVTGATHLNRDQIVALGGLTTGRAITSVELDAAVKKLLGTGLLTAVHYSVQPDGAGVRLTLDVVEPLWTMAVLLDNFIWFTDEEIYEAVAREIPTFDGAVPDTEAALDTVTRVLQGLLDDRKIPGRVEHRLSIILTVGRQKQRFMVTGIRMAVCAVKFLHASPANEVELLKASKFVVGGQYSREQLFRTMEGNFVPIYKQRGYLEGVFHAPLAVRRSTPDCDGVDISIEVEEGVVFSLGGVVWVGNTAVSAGALTTALAVKIGERADTVKLGAGLTAVSGLYWQRGYLDFSSAPTLRLDRASRLVTYHVSLTEGAVYQMGALRMDGVADRDAGRLTRAWPIKGGAPFDLVSAKGFPARAKLTGLVPANSTLSVDITPSAETHVVDVKITFRPKKGPGPIS